MGVVVMRGLGGFRPWLLQRISALYLGVYMVAMFVRLVWFPFPDSASWHAWLAQPWVWMATALFFLALLIHAWIGVRNVVLDYIKPTPVKLVLLLAFMACLVALGLWSVRALMMVMMV